MQHEAQKRQIVENYIKAYNAFDVAGMVRDMHQDVIFENISDGSVNLRTAGVEAFQEQAEQAKAYFSEREQQLEKLSFSGEVAEASIAYRAVLATDLPNGMKAGDELTLQGKSVFYFEGTKIIKLQDFS